MIDDIHAANGLVLVYYWNEGGWDGTLGSFEYISDYIQHENYVSDQVAPWSTIPYVPYQFVIDLPTRNVLGKDTSAAQLTAGQIVTLVEDNNT